MKKNYTIIIALLLFSALNAKNKVLNVSPPPNTPPTIVAAAGQYTELQYCPGSPLANIEFIVGDRETLFKDLVVTFASSNQAYIADSEITAYPEGPFLGSVTNGQRYLGITGNTIIPPVFVNGFTDITVTVTDGDGLTVTQVFRIYIVDSSQPTIVKTGDIASGYVDRYLSSDSCSYTLEDFTGNVTVSDDCTDTPAIVITQQANLNGTTYNIGDIIQGQHGVVEVTLTATDLVGKTASTIFTITLQDVYTPVLVIINSVVNEDLPVAATNCKFTIKDYTSNVFFSDDCSPMVTITQTPAAGTIVDFSSTNPEQIITFTCIDYAGNSAMDSFTVKVIDLTNPVAKAKDFFVAELDATGIYTFTGDELNDGSTDNCQIVNYTCYPAFVDCSNLGTPVTVTMTVTDFSGNISTSTTTVIVLDITNPVIYALPIQQNTNTCDTYLGYDPTFNVIITDNCMFDPATLIGTRSDGKDIWDTYSIGTTTITWNVTDINGNAAIPATQTVTMVDTEFPKFVDADVNDVLPSSTLNQSDFTLTYANATALGSTDVYPTAKLVKPTVVDLTQCNGADEVTTITFTPEFLHLGTNTVTWTATDIYGNIATATQEVTIEDTTIPVIKLKTTPITKSLGSNGQVVITPADLDNGTTDEFNGNALKLIVIPNTFGCESTGKDVSVIFYAEDYVGGLIGTDANGVMGDVSHKVYKQTTVRIEDTEIPVINSNGNQDVNTLPGLCGALVSVSATATDNCTVGSPVGVRSDSKGLTEVYPLGTTTITWNVTDANLNAAVAVIQKVVVTDAQFPVIAAAVTLDKTTTVGQCGWTPTLLGVPSATATDNCTVGTPIGKRSDNLALNALYPIGTTTITWTVNDVNGNVAYPVTTAINVQDVTAPVVVTKNIQLVLDNGSVTIKPTDVLVSATDACGVNIMSYDLDKSTFTIADVSNSPITIFLTVKDIYGNTTVTPVLVTFTNLSVDTYKKEKEITIYPNPTTSVLHLQCSNEVIIDKVVVRDLNGKIVVQQAEITSEINVEKLAAGIYTLEADSGKNKFKTKFIKE